MADENNDQQVEATGTAGDKDAWDQALSKEEGASEENPKAELSSLKEDPTLAALAGDHPDIDIILDIPVKISMEVGSTEISIRNLLHLNQGSVIELDRFAGEPLDVMVNGTLIAHGEVVVVNEKFGIRLTDILSASERIAKIR